MNADELLELEPTMLTTKDNPYNPKEQFDEWFVWDRENGYYTPEYLARIAQLNAEDDTRTGDIILELAKLEIIDNDELGLYILV